MLRYISFIADAHASTQAHARYSDWPTRAEDTVDSGVIKELIVLRGNNTATHDDYITVNKPTQKQSILNPRPLLYFSILIGPFLYHVTNRDYQVTRTKSWNVQYDGNQLKNPPLIEVQEKSLCFH